LTLYLDTSLLVAALTKEPKTTQVQRWLREQAATTFAISDWVITEFSAAMSLKVRSRQITTAGRAAALGRFTLWAEESFNLLAVSSLHFRTAARFADQYALGVRAADALHIAICAGHGATLCTLDHRLGAAAPALGVKAIRL
jgi:uncharacterized protein